MDKTQLAIGSENGRTSGFFAQYEWMYLDQNYGSCNGVHHMTGWKLNDYTPSGGWTTAIGDLTGDLATTDVDNDLYANDLQDEVIGIDTRYKTLDWNFCGNINSGLSYQTESEDQYSAGVVLDYEGIVSEGITRTSTSSGSYTFAAPPGLCYDMDKRGAGDALAFVDKGVAASVQPTVTEALWGLPSATPIRMLAATH